MQYAPKSTSEELRRKSIKRNLEHYWGIAMILIKSPAASTASLDDLWAAVTYSEITNHFSNEGYIPPNYNANFPHGRKPTFKSLFSEYCMEKKNLLIEPEINEADVIVDLGSGWGRNAVFLAQKYPDKTIIALEYSDAGVSCTQFLAQKYGLDNIVTSLFDYYNPVALREVVFPQASNKKSAYFVSSYSIEQIPNLGESFISDIINSPFESVSFLHVEPIGWQVRKVHKNTNPNYNNDLFSILEKMQRDSLIDIKKVEVDVFGDVNNPGTKVFWSRI